MKKRENSKEKELTNQARHSRRWEVFQVQFDFTNSIKVSHDFSRFAFFNIMPGRIRTIIFTEISVRGAESVTVIGVNLKI